MLPELPCVSLATEIITFTDNTSGHGLFTFCSKSSLPPPVAKLLVFMVCSTPRELLHNGGRVVPGNNINNSLCYYPKFSSFLWMNDFQFVICICSISRVLRWVFFTLSSLLLFGGRDLPTSSFHLPKSCLCPQLLLNILSSSRVPLSLMT